MCFHMKKQTWASPDPMASNDVYHQLTCTVNQVLVASLEGRPTTGQQDANEEDSRMSKSRHEVTSFS
jgi:hypothetical protein